MRTARLFLGVFALALILPLLLLAYVGSDEPTDGPSSERSTGEPTSRASSGRATAGPTSRASSGRATAGPTSRASSGRATAGPTSRASSGRATAGPTSRASSGRATAGPTSRASSGQATAGPTASPPVAQTLPETDREALVALYNATGGPTWIYKSNWLSDVPISEWSGVSTDYYNGRVISLDLDRNQLSGEIPPELGNLANVEYLDLSRNQLSGEIPAELGNLANLTILNLDGNQLTGCLPSSLSGQLKSSGEDGFRFCSSTTAEPTVSTTAGPSMAQTLPEMDREAVIALYGGSIYVEAKTVPIGEWKGVTTDANGRVTELDYPDIGWSGEIPPELGNLTRLTKLDLSKNEFSGEIPPELGNLANVEYLDLSRNQLSGEVPAELGNSANLRELVLHENQLTGCVPISLWGQSRSFSLGDLQFCQ